MTPTPYRQIGDICQIDIVDPWPPIDIVPRHLYPPYTQHYPAYHQPRREDLRVALENALGGLPLGEFDQKLIELLILWGDVPTFAGLLSWLHRARRAGPL
ncbi:MAG TPA: hypothetical protein VK735_18520 [Pseudonocardia sp.]|uniref:hypothetical protein n=1 Tax=Pseudonocardia sp. TaxID=60912 RepID=UPI002C651100|nr:hypothetical protein [Pseudonocardia sp.]HTF49441.1 hypothetical protein [Pseudonocardia sp.]